MSAETFARDLLAKAGMGVDGKKPYDLKVYNPRFYSRVLTQGSRGLGDSYIEKWWDCDDLAECINRILRANLAREIGITPQSLLIGAQSALWNLQSRARAFQVAHQHYDHPDILYERMLDKTRGYTCADWSQATTLEGAQIAKFERVCRKLHFNPGENVLDVGPGWGGLMAYAVRNYAVHATGVSVSKEQTAWANQRYYHLGRGFDIKLQDWRSIPGRYDKVMSVGMFEAVGRKNAKAFFRKIRSVMRDHGLFVLHTIWAQDPYSAKPDPWIHKHIFPNGELLLSKEIVAAAEEFDLLHMESFGLWYDRTLQEWNGNFQKARMELEATLGPQFCRMWEYYLLSCAGAFRSGNITVGQFVFAPKGKHANTHVFA